jgi:hypothetical protein
VVARFRILAVRLRLCLFGFPGTSRCSGQIVNTNTILLMATSAGFYSSSAYLGLARFERDGTVFCECDGGGCGRGFNIAVINPTNGVTLEIRHYDTWVSALHAEVAAYLNSLQDGVVVLIAVADEAGINQWDSCAMSTLPGVEN